MDYHDKEWLTQKYVVENLSAPEIGKLCGCASPTVRYWLAKFGIQIRSQADTIRGKYTGSNSPSWGLKRSEDTRRKVSEHHADVSGQNNPMYGMSGEQSPSYGKPRNQEHRQRLSRALKGKTRPYITKEQNPNWKGGKTPLVLAIRNSPKGIEWRGAVFTRDKFTCQECWDGQGGNLNAHHVEPLSALIQMHGIKTLEDAYACSAIWDTANGVTLCKRCHGYRHQHNLLHSRSEPSMAP